MTSDRPTSPAPSLSQTGLAGLEQELASLYQRINYERATPGPGSGKYPRYFKLESMRMLLDELGNPHHNVRIVHVAGTKGKGSVCQMIAAGLIHSGARTGRYSSPHIRFINERIEVNGSQIPDADLAEALRTVRRATERLQKQNPIGNSFFEVITATALWYFARQSVEFVVLEVGLGGRLDSTNVCLPELCVITNISLDHTRQLGTVVDKIAREKAGIIKQRIPVVSGATDPLASREIRESCSVRNCRLMELGRDFSYEITGIDPKSMSLTLDTRGEIPASDSPSEPGAAAYQIRDVRLNQVGNHQAENAAVAIAALQVIGQTDARVSESATRKAVASFSLPGRCEVLSRHPLIVIDMAHNVASVSALIETLQKLSGARACTHRRLVFASSEDKDLPGMLGQLLPEFDQVVFTRFLMNPRATDPARLLEIARTVQGSSPGDAVPRISVTADPAAAWQMVMPGSNDLVCVAGSAFLVAELRPLIQQTLSNSPLKSAPLPGA